MMAVIHSNLTGTTDRLLRYIKTQEESSDEIIDRLEKFDATATGGDSHSLRGRVRRGELFEECGGE